MSEQEKILQRLEKYRNEIERIFKERVIQKYEFVEPFCKIKITFDGNKLSYSVADDGICIKLLLIFFHFKLLRLKGDPNTANEPINLPLSSRAYYRPKTDRATSAYLRMMLKGVEPNRAKKWYEKATKKELKDGKIQEILSVYGFPSTIENTFKGIYYHFEKVLKEDKSKKVELVAWALTSLYGYTPSASLDIPIEVTFNIIYQLLNLAEYGI